MILKNRNGGSLTIGLALTLLICFLTPTMFGQNLKVTNANWFDGEGFSKRTVWIYNGKLSFTSKNQINERTLNLSDKYVIPPFGEAHNHNLESSHEIDKRIAKYFSHGVFYVKVQSSIKKRILPLMPKYNHPLGLDVSLAHAPITGTDGHPIGIRKWYLEQGYFGNLFKTLKEIESHGYIVQWNGKERP